MKRKWIKHINTPNGSRKHVIWWDYHNNGHRKWAERHCSEPNCELNKPKKELE